MEASPTVLHVLGCMARPRKYVASAILSLFYSIVDTITQDRFKQLEIEEHFEEAFPNTITLDQTVAVWKHIVSYQEELKQQQLAN